MKLTHNDGTKPANNHSTQIAPVKRLEYVKVALRDPRNTTATETRMRYEVTKAPGSDSMDPRSRSFDKYSGRQVDNLDVKYHTRSTQSSLNSHKRYLGVSLRVSYDSRKKKLHKHQH